LLKPVKLFKEQRAPPRQLKLNNKKPSRRLKMPSWQR